MNIHTRFIAAMSVAFVCFATPVQADGSRTVKGDYIGCLTEDALDEMTQALIHKDMRQAEALSNVCLPLKGRPYSVVEQGWVTSRIRVYTSDGRSLVFWVPAEAARE